jgi:hypothetical protein
MYDVSKVLGNESELPVNQQRLQTTREFINNPVQNLNSPEITTYDSKYQTPLTTDIFQIKPTSSPVAFDPTQHPTQHHHLANNPPNTEGYFENLIPIPRLMYAETTRQVIKLTTQSHTAYRHHSIFRPAPRPSPPTNPLPHGCSSEDVPKSTTTTSWCTTTNSHLPS